VWTTSAETLRPFNAFLIRLNIEKDLSPEQLVTFKLGKKGVPVVGFTKNHSFNLTHSTQWRKWRSELGGGKFS